MPTYLPVVVLHVHGIAVPVRQALVNVARPGQVSSLRTHAWREVSLDLVGLRLVSQPCGTF